MAKYPSEIFGHPHYAADEKAVADRARHWCPFVDKRCYKQSRLIPYPFGICSLHIRGEEIAVCPRRFLDHHSIFYDIAQFHFQTTNDLLIFPEVQLKDIGSFDFVMVKHKPMSLEIEDFAVIELQTGQTTGTGKLVEGLKDFLAGQNIVYRSYGFNLNTYDIWKRTFTQVLNKGVIMESWGHKIYWVVQEPIYRDFEKRYHLQDIGFHDEHSTVFALYDLVPRPDRFELVATRKTSASIDQLFGAFRNNPNIPPLDMFLQKLRTKMTQDVHLSLSLGRLAKGPSLDVKPPTPSGRIREGRDDEEGKDKYEA